jgi:hypothetical protein
MLDLTREEIEALLWSVAVVGHAYRHDHTDDGAGRSAAEKLEAALAEKRGEA